MTNPDRGRRGSSAPANELPVRRRCRWIGLLVAPLFVAGLSLLYAPPAGADDDVSITSAEATDTLIPGRYGAKVKVVVTNHKAVAGQESVIETSGDAITGVTSSFKLGAPGTAVTHEAQLLVKKDAKPGPTTITVTLKPRGKVGQPALGKDTKTVQATVGTAPPACNEVTIESEAYRVGLAKGRADGTEDGYAEAYKKSYDDTMETKPGLTADECRALAAKGYHEGYVKAYDPAYQKALKEGAKSGKKEGKEDQGTGISRAVKVSSIGITSDPPSGEAVCGNAVRFTAAITATGPGILQFHWVKSPGTATPKDNLQFGGPGAETKKVSELVAIPEGATSVDASAQLKIDTGPSKGKSETASVTITCKKAPAP